MRRKIVVSVVWAFVVAVIFSLLQSLEARAQDSSENNNKSRWRASILVGYQHMPSFLLKLGGDVQESPAFLHGDTESLLVGYDVNRWYTLYASLGRASLAGHGSWRRDADPRAEFVNGRAIGKTEMDVHSVALGAERRFFLSENRKNIYFFARLFAGAALLEGKFRGQFIGFFRDTVPPEVGVPGDAVIEPATDDFRRIIPVVDISLGVRLGLDTVIPGADRWSIGIGPHINQIGYGGRVGVDGRFDLPF